MKYEVLERFVSEVNMWMYMVIDGYSGKLVEYTICNDRTSKGDILDMFGLYDRLIE